MRSDNKADLEKLEARIRDSKDKALVRELLVRVQKLHRLTLAYYMFSLCSFVPRIEIDGIDMELSTCTFQSYTPNSPWNHHCPAIV